MRLNRIQLLKKVDAIVGPILARFFPALPSAGGAVGEVRRILLIRPGGIGDAVLLGPSLRAIKGFYPDSRVEILAESRNHAIFELCPEVGTVYRYDRPAEFLACIRQSYDVVIDTEQWHRFSALVARLMRTGLRIGFSTNERARLFHRPVPYAQEDYESENFLRLFDVLGQRAEAPPMPCLVVPEGARQRIEGLLPADVPALFVIIFPGASIPERRWGAARFARLTVLLGARGVPVVIVGGPEDREEGARIVAEGWGLNLAGKTSLVETAAVIERSALLVSGDSGVLHIGVGLDRPTVSLFGPGIAQKWAPRGEKHMVLDKHLPCSPCTEFGHTPKCPIDAKCMKDISVNEVFAAIMDLIAKTQRAG